MRMALERWCKRKSHLLIFFGGLTVFLTFVVKEGLHDHWQQVADAIDMAHYVYSIRVQENQDVLQVRDELNGVEGLAESIAQPVRTFKQMDDRIKLNEPRDFRARAKQVEAALDQISLLIDKLPEPDDDRKELARLNAALPNLRGEIDYLESLYPDPLGEQRPPAEPTRKWTYVAKHPVHKMTIRDEETLNPFTKDPGARTINIYDSLADMESDTSVFEKQVLNEADRIRERNERHSVFAWWTSAILFVAGWGLGLVGKLYGVPEAGGNG